MSHIDTHTWDVSPKEAVEIQKKLKSEIKLQPLPRSIRLIAGADVSFNRYEKDVYAGIVVLSYPELEVVEKQCVRVEVNFPYVSGLLSFREIPPLLKVWEKIKHTPDIVVVDGQGIAHPRRLGIASHFGLVVNTPTIGCAKSVLYGIPEHELKPDVGGVTYMKDPKTNERIGVFLQSKVRSNPLIISPGHMCDVDSALHLVSSCLRGYRLPEPTRQAHLSVNECRKAAK
jgi:deoxyribonuclease V